MVSLTLLSFMPFSLSRSLAVGFHMWSLLYLSHSFYFLVFLMSYCDRKLSFLKCILRNALCCLSMCFKKKQYYSDFSYVEAFLHLKNESYVVTSCDLFNVFFNSICPYFVAIYTRDTGSVFLQYHCLVQVSQ